MSGERNININTKKFVTVLFRMRKEVEYAYVDLLFNYIQTFLHNFNSSL